MPRVRKDPHNTLSKFAFGQPEDAGPLLRAVLAPELVKAIDWRTLHCVDAEYTEPAMRETRSDTLFSARLKGRKVFLFVLFEHQSTVEKWMALRLLGYMLRTWEKERANKVATLTPIFPLVLYHGERRWTASRSFAGLFRLPLAKRDLFGSALPDFEYLPDDLSQYSDRELLGRALTALGTSAIALLRHGKNLKDVSRLLGPWLQAFQAVARAPNGLEALRAVLSYLSLVSELDDSEFRRFVHEIGPGAEEAYVTHAQKLEQMLEQKVEQRLRRKVEQEVEERIARQVEQRIARQVEQRIAQQALEDRRSLVEKQLTIRFGKLGPEATTALHNATAEELELWAERLLTAKSLAEVIGRASQP